MSLRDRIRWDARYARRGAMRGEEPRAFLRAVADRLPREGRALDLACGEGQNAVYLASRGLEVEALDISPVAISKAHKLARRKGVRIHTRVVDLEADPEPIPAGRYRLILCFRYLQRSLAPRIEAGLAPDGMVVLELIADRTRERHPERSPDHLIASGELERWFPNLIVVHHEEAREKNVFLNRLIASKPPV